MIVNTAKRRDSFVVLMPDFHRIANGLLSGLSEPARKPLQTYAAMYKTDQVRPLLISKDILRPLDPKLRETIVRALCPVALDGI